MSPRVSGGCDHGDVVDVLRRGDQDGRGRQRCRGGRRHDGRRRYGRHGRPYLLGHRIGGLPVGQAIDAAVDGPRAAQHVAMVGERQAASGVEGRGRALEHAVAHRDHGPANRDRDAHRMRQPLEAVLPAELQQPLPAVRPAVVRSGVEGGAVDLVGQRLRILGERLRQDFALISTRG